MPRSDDYKHGYSAGFQTGKRHQKDELAKWQAVFDRNAELEREIARLEKHANAIDEKLTKILTDAKYEGGVQYWIQKHDALLASFGHLLETPPPPVETAGT